MKTATLKVVLMVLVLSAAVACGKRNPNAMNMTKAGPGTGASDYDALAYNETPAKDGTHQFITSGTSTAPLVPLKSLDSTKRIYFGVTLAFRKANNKNLKTPQYRLTLDEWITCNDGPSTQEYSPGKTGTLQYRILHTSVNGAWPVANGVVTLASLGSFLRDPAPPPSIDATTKKPVKKPRPTTGKLKFTVGIGDPELITGGPWATSLGSQSRDYAGVESDSTPTYTQADALTKIGNSCQGVKAVAPITSATADTEATDLTDPDAAAAKLIFDSDPSL